MWYAKGLILCACFIHYSSSLPRVDPLVDTQVGLIRGLQATDGDYSMFMGIPYATVNENNPFGVSVAHPGFEEVFEAYDDSSICPQLEEFNNTIVGTLDCLHLNIYVPNSANSRNKLPVLVWIYGGGFTIGFSGRYVYGPKYLMKQDVVVVTLNYRLGPYGFMNLNTPEVPGNQGIKDQQTALRWIKNNIDAFGGDSNQITLWGESAGAASVDLHLTYGQEQLFNKVIMQSGVSLSPWAIIEPDTAAATKLASTLGFVTTDSDEALEFLKNLEPKIVMAASLELDLQFKVSVETSFDNVEQFIYEHPINIKNINLQNIPILIGYNKDERLPRYEFLTPAEYASSNKIHEFLEQKFNFEPDYHNEMEAIFRHFYIGDEEPSEAVKEGLVRFDSDMSFNHPITRRINNYFENGARNIYSYLFSYDGDRNFVKQRLNITSPGAAHADEIGYLFDISYITYEPNNEDLLIVERLTTMWANFAKYGNPTPQVNELLPVEWPVATQELWFYLNIDSELKVEKRSFKERMAMWDLFYKLNEKYQRRYKDTDN